MKAILLSAGQGRRLLPLTRSVPKCLLPVEGERTLLELQLGALQTCGIRSVVIMVGFGAEQVEKHVALQAPPGMEVRTRYNPFFATTENLITCWLAVTEMAEDFVLLNGDTLFEPAVLARLLAAPSAPITLAIDHKDRYDEDDMKVELREGRRLRAVSKTLDPRMSHGESIGLMLFREEGAKAFATALAASVRNRETHARYYLSVLHELATQRPVETVSIDGLWWSEIDSPDDLAAVRSALQRRAGSRRAAPPARAAARPSPVERP